MGKTDEVTVGGRIWVDVESPTLEEIQLLGHRFNFDQLELEDCMSRQLQKIEHHEDHLFIIIHRPYLPEESKIVTSDQVSVFLGEEYLVTVHQGNFRSIGEIFRSYKDERDPSQTGVEDALHSILESLVDSMFPLLRGIMKEVDDVEDEVFDEAVDVVRELTTLRRNIAALRRTIQPLRRIMAGLYDELQMIGADLAPAFKDLSDDVEKAFAILEEARETVEIYKDTDFTLNTDRSNKILAILTIMFTLSIPGTLIGAFYGMNVALPGGLETGSWAFLGRYTTLIVMVLASVASALVMLLHFRRLRWI